MIEISRAALNLQGQPMFQILARAKQLEAAGVNILHFELGDPDFSANESAKQAVIEAINNNDTHYAPSSGIYELKEAIAKSDLTTKGFVPDIDQLLVTAGANIQLYYAIACTVNPGDEVIVPDPGFVSYYSILNYLKAKIVRVPLREENNWRLNPDDVLRVANDKTKMIIINSPSNPTGAVMTKEEIEGVYGVAEFYNAVLLSDEVYGKIRYDEVNQYSPCVYDKCKERVVVVNSFSKSYAMTGFRLGVCMGPKHIIEKMGLLLEATSSCVSPFIQRSGVAALQDSKNQTSIMLHLLDERRKGLVKGLNEINGISCKMPQGAFYALANISKTGMTGTEFADKLLTEAGIAVTPGIVFGNEARDYVRFSYTTRMANIYEAIDRMKELL